MRPRKLPDGHLHVVIDHRPVNMPRVAEKVHMGLPEAGAVLAVEQAAVTVIAIGRCKYRQLVFTPFAPYVQLHFPPVKLAHFPGGILLSDVSLPGLCFLATDVITDRGVPDLMPFGQKGFIDVYLLHRLLIEPLLALLSILLKVILDSGFYFDGELPFPPVGTVVTGSFNYRFDQFFFYFRRGKINLRAGSLIAFNITPYGKTCYMEFSGYFTLGTAVPEVSSILSLVWYS